MRILSRKEKSMSRHWWCILSLGFCLVMAGSLSISSAPLFQSAMSTEKNSNFSFKVELQQRPEIASVVSSEGREGKLVASGDGSMQGPMLHGKLHWSNFEKVGEKVCQMNLAGFIETDDGAHIDFESTGYALLVNPPTWNTAGIMRFSTKENTYAWLNGRLSAWHGEFDPNSRHAVMQSF